MKIDKDYMQRVSARLKRLDAFACCTEGSKVIEELIEALEQHHKDLVGLVVSWKEESEMPFTSQEEAHAWHTCATRLSSLINPKD